jgi:DNA polymerase-3 subunit gamma/tau
MSYLVLARKWRPQGFDDLIGQQPIVRVLTNSLDQGKIAHAYIFSGPRGVGKTSTARILAKSLNCVEGPTATPCGKCGFCASITEGTSVDVLEIDGASNNSVDHIRDLRERVKYAPSGGRYKVYIIDEAHMLSGSAFNALLKTLEEPPPHVVFVLATTEARKIPLTVMSRCQHLPFRRVSTQAIKERLGMVSGSEGITISESALGLIARAADGSIRDSLTILDQLASFSSEISEADVKGLLDIADFRMLADVSDAVIQGNREDVLKAVSDLVETGTDLRAFVKDLVKFFRDLLVARVTSSPEAALDLGNEEMPVLTRLAARVSEEYLTLLLSELIKAESDVRSSSSPRVALEMSLLKISYLSTLRTVNEAIAALGGTRARDDDVGQTERGSLPEPDEDAGDDEEDSTIQDAEGQELSGPVSVHSGDSLLQAILDNTDDPRINSKLHKARPELKGNTLSLTFNSSDAAICAKPFKDDPSAIEKLASELMGMPTKLEIHIKQHKSPGQNDLKEKALSEPLVKEALDLFEGRIVNIKQAKENQH